MTQKIKAIALTAEAFAPYGEVIQNAVKKFNRDEPDMVYCDTKHNNGTTVINIIQPDARPIPANIAFFERHPIGSQAFIPMAGTGRMLIVVAGFSGENEPCDPTKAVAFISDGTQGVQYKKNVWHGALYSLDEGTKFATIDRGRNENEPSFNGTNCDFDHLEENSLIVEL